MCNGKSLSVENDRPWPHMFGRFSAARNSKKSGYHLFSEFDIALNDTDAQFNACFNPICQSIHGSLHRDHAPPRFRAAPHAEAEITSSHDRRITLEN